MKLSPKCAHICLLLRTAFLRSIITILLLSFFAAIMQVTEDEDWNKKEIKNGSRSLSNTLLELKRKYKLNMTDKLFLTIAEDITVTSDNFDESEKSWTFRKAYYVVLTIVTTIGYGDVVPLTDSGRVICIFCGIIGIPVMLLTLKSIGDLIHDSISVTLEVLERRWLKRQACPYKEYKILLITCVLSWCFPLLGGWWESHKYDWDFFIGFYAWFVTLSTIGFGDFVVSKSYIQGDDDDAESTLGTIGVVLWLFLGLGVVASIINATTNLIETNKKLQRCCQICFGIDRKRRLQRSPAIRRHDQPSSTEADTGDKSDGTPDSEGIHTELYVYVADDDKTVGKDGDVYLTGFRQRDEAPNVLNGK